MYIFTHTYIQREIFLKGIWSTSHAIFPPSGHIQGRLPSDLWCLLNKEVSSRNQFGWASQESPLKDSWLGSKFSTPPPFSHWRGAGLFSCLPVIREHGQRMGPLGALRTAHLQYSSEKIKYSPQETKTRAWGPSQNKMEFEAITPLTQQQN